MEEPRDVPPVDADWSAESERPVAGHLQFVLDLDGFEGPLDLLLTLARDQKVDLLQVSIVALADQYLAFIDAARRNHLDLAVDYLVMAAWLTYLKSRLLLPVEKDDDEPSAEELAEELARRLRRLEAIRGVAARLINRGQMGRDVFLRGASETRETTITKVWDDTLFDLLSAYAAHRRKIQKTVFVVERRTVWSLKDAREILLRLTGDLADWLPLETFVAPFLRNPAERATVLASTFSAGLELAREGAIEMQQGAAFEPIFVRTRKLSTAKPARPSRDSGSHDEASDAPGGDDRLG